jgi:hypothetical protein
MADEYSTPIPKGATVDAPQSQPSSQSAQPAPVSQNQDEYTAPIPQGATIGDVTQTNVQTPNNVYRAAPDEQTPEGHEAAIARREAQLPTLAAIGRGSGEALSDTWDTVKNLPSSVWHSLPPVGAFDSINQAIPVFKAYEDARSSGKGIVASLSIANDVAAKHDAAQQALQKRIDEFKQAPGRATVRALGDAAVILSTMYDGGQRNPANVEEPVKPNTAVVTHRFTPAQGVVSVETEAGTEAAAPTKAPGLVKQIMQGEKVAQPGAQQAVRRAVQTSADTAETTDAALAESLANKPLLQGNSTVLDEHLARLLKQEQEAYSKADEVAGFDVKAEKQQLSNDQYKLKQLGNTDSDITQKGNLIESINDSQTRISEAEEKMRAAGVDPKAADAIHKQRMAGNDFRKNLVNNTGSDGQSVNVDGLLNASKKLRFSKYGDRLEQFFGSNEAADKFMAQLEDAQKLGQKALTKQSIARMVGKYVGLPLIGTGVGTAIYEATH